ncbi:MAG: transporter substrate-binding domain-containing protein, partial [Clostridia bacterium]|nr:transporter substrate-binding domain-containing protein [Clostridia bacterium]
MKNIKKILAITLAVLFALSLTACGEKKEETKQETLLVATNAEFEPYESLDADGNCIGFDIDLMNAIGEKLGVKVQYDNMEFDGVVSAVNSGSCDAAISALTINAKRKQSVDFADAYYSGAAQILIVSANDTAFTGTTKEELDAQLKNKKIGVCSG